MEESTKKSVFAQPGVQAVTGMLVIALLLGGALYWKAQSTHISIEKSVITAPTIAIGPQAGGILAEVYVRPGDTVSASQQVARVGSEVLSAAVAGTVISVQNTPGQVVMPGAAVVAMIVPSELRVVGTIAEDKGLRDIAVGQPVSFTVDAFGSTEYTGIVDEVSPTSDESGVAFSISDKREVKSFAIKVRFDTAAHPEFKNGMSAKMNVYIK
ncbi:MAG: HlyD family efflux transporter periplasmic adaptor subunit [Patescibacteria group bacterium]